MASFSRSTAPRFKDIQSIAPGPGQYDPNFQLPRPGNVKTSAAMASGARFRDPKCEPCSTTPVVKERKRARTTPFSAGKSRKRRCSRLRQPRLLAIPEEDSMKQKLEELETKYKSSLENLEAKETFLLSAQNEWAEQKDNLHGLVGRLETRITDLNQALLLKKEALQQEQETRLQAEDANAATLEEARVTETALRGELEKATAAAQNAKNTLKNMEQQLNASRSVVQELSREGTVVRFQLAAHSAALFARSKENDALVGNATELQKQKSSLSAKLEEERKKTMEATQLVNAVQQQNMELSCNLQSAVEENASQALALEAACAEVSTLRFCLEEKLVQLKKQEETVASLEQTVNTLQEECKRCAAEAASAQAELQQLSTSLENECHRTTELRERAQQQSARRKELVADLAAAKLALGAALARELSLQNALRAERQTSADLRSLLASKKNELETTRKELQESREEVTSAQLEGVAAEQAAQLAECQRELVHAQLDESVEMARREEARADRLELQLEAVRQTMFEELDAARLELRAAATRERELAAQGGQLERQCAQQQEQLAEAKKKVRKLCAHVKVEKQARDVVKRELEALQEKQTRRREADQELVTLRRERNALCRQSVDLTAQLQTGQAELASVEQRLQEETARNAELGGHRNPQQRIRQHRTVKLENAELHKRNAELRAELTKLRLRVSAGVRPPARKRGLHELATNTDKDKPAAHGKPRPLEGGRVRMQGTVD